LSSPSWWFSRARAELKSIQDPQESTLIGQMISSAQGSLAPAEELPQAIRQQFEAHRAILGDDADWQFALFAASQYKAAHRFREAIEAIDRGRSDVDELSDPSKRARIYREFDSALDAGIGRAASSGEIVLALESVRLLREASRRESKLEHVASCRATIDVEAAIKKATRLSAVQTPVEWRLLLLIHARSGPAEQYERAIRQLLDDRTSMETNDVMRCYRALANTLEQLPARTDAKLLDALAAQLSRDAAAGTKENARDDVSNCLATLHIVRGDLTAAKRLTDSRGRPVLHGSFSLRATQLLVTLGRFDEALEVSPAAHQGIAVAHRKAGRLDQALQSIARFENRGAGYAGYAADVAKAFAERDDWRGVERAMALIDDHAAWLHVLAQVTRLAARAGRKDEVQSLIREGTRRMEKIDDSNDQLSASNSLVAAHLAVGDVGAAAKVADRSPSDFARSMMLVAIAEHQLAAQDKAGFEATLQRLALVTARAPQRTPPKDSSADATSEWDRPREILIALMAGRLFLRADDPARARGAISRGFARAGESAGAVWKADIYFGLLPGGELTAYWEPFTPRDVAMLMECVPMPADRAMLALVGGMMAVQAKQHQEPGPP
jgi:hypothetical protein